MAHAAGSHDSHGDQHGAAHADDGPTSGPGGGLLAFILAVATTVVTVWALLTPRAGGVMPVAPPVAIAPPPAVVAPHVVPAAEAGPLGAMVERSLAGGAKVSVPERGVEGRLLAFIQDPSRPADKTTWFDFDRLTFETGAATLAAASRDQLAAVGAILAAYPAVKLKIGGYTDNVGDPAFNQKLSDQRAANVRAALIGLGVAPDRLSSEGYGDQFPVADNATPEGRAQNRRISMRVAEK
jgi:outer membrane protein OmpA-like peptidoglycan-associated protein